ncbi:MAG: SRPBCC family protein [Planctomycetota bacterium]
MPQISIETRIAAPTEVCFDLARNIDFHVRSLEHTGERAVAGVTSGLIGLDESVTWEAKHLGIRQRLTSKITAFDPPHHFQDTMTRGAFKRFVHDHLFVADGDATIMRDVIDFASPLGPLGWVTDRVLMGGYLRQLITDRGVMIRAEAERLTSLQRVL